MPRVAAPLASEFPAPSIQHMYGLAPSFLLGDGDGPGRATGLRHPVVQPCFSREGGRSMAQHDPADIPEQSPDDGDGAIVVWRPSPNRPRLIWRWTFRCVVAGALVAGAWSLRERYTHIDLSGTGPAKQVQETRAHVDQPVAVGTPRELTVITDSPKKPPAEWRPPLDTRSVVRTIPSE
jgi:hypothetical protein